MHRASVLIAFLIAVAALVAAPAPETVAPVSPAFNIAVDVYPSSRDPIQLLRRQTPSTYTCQVLVAPPDSKDTYVHVRMIAEPEKPETLVRTFGDELVLKFTVIVRSTRNEARAVVEISRAGRILARQASNIQLRQPERSVTPVE